MENVRKLSDSMTLKILTLRWGFVDTEQLVDVDTDAHILFNELSMSNDAGLGLSEHGDSSREIESRSSSLNIVPKPVV